MERLEGKSVAFWDNYKDEISILLIVGGVALLVLSLSYWSDYCANRGEEDNSYALYRAFRHNAGVIDQAKGDLRDPVLIKYYAEHAAVFRDDNLHFQELAQVDYRKAVWSTVGSGLILFAGGFCALAAFTTVKTSESRQKGYQKATKHFFEKAVAWLKDKTGGISARMMTLIVALVGLALILLAVCFWLKFAANQAEKVELQILHDEYVKNVDGKIFHLGPINTPEKRSLFFEYLKDGEKVAFEVGNSQRSVANTDFISGVTGTFGTIGAIVGLALSILGLRRLFSPLAKNIKPPTIFDASATLDGDGD